MEDEQVEAVPLAPPKPVVEEKIEFDEWHVMRKNAIPTHHRKEILLADFKARKVPMTARVQDFDEALKKYGVKLS